MYQPSQPALFTWGSEQGYASTYNLFHANGTYVRSGRGEVIERSAKKQNIVYIATYENKEIKGRITDPLLVHRITTYMNEYYGKEHTNCSGFAHYLTTGNFVACTPGDGMLILKQSMRPFRSGMPVHVGDMVCIIYAERRLHQSRKWEHRNNFLTAKKTYHAEGSFGACLTLKEDRFYTPEEIERFFRGGGAPDYHFMVCADKQNGNPIWISQWGRYAPNEASAPLAISDSEHDLSLDAPPLLTFIRRRR